jgi:hypothetical protein
MPNDPISGAQALSDPGLIKTRNVVAAGLEDGFDTLGSNELHRARSVLANLRDQGKRIAGRHLEILCPPGQHELVVGEQSPDVGLDAFVGMFQGGKRHGQRQGITPPRFPPDRIVGKLEHAAFILRYPADRASRQKYDKFLAQDDGPRALRTIELMSTGSSSFD